MTSLPTSSATPSEPLDILVVGAGFAGLYTLIAARRHGVRAIALEAADGVGGVWQWNRYPGARCDIESLDYSYSFDADLQNEWTWSERYATQPEILRYAEHVVSRFDLSDMIHLNTRVASAHFDDDLATWNVVTEDGTNWTARHVVLATGSLSAPVRPDIEGLESFEGEVVYTARWPHDGLDVSGRRVGVIGTGSSGIQSIPILASTADQLTVFQRSANYSVPVLNRSLSPEDLKQALLDYPRRRAISRMSMAGTPSTTHPRSYWELTEKERQEAFEKRWNEGGVLFGKVFDGQTVDERINDAARRFAEAKIREAVHDPTTAADLTPDHAIGTKRICTDSGYFETFNRSNVDLVNLRRDPITRVSAEGIETRSGFHELDVLVLATGFDALTGAISAIDIVGPGGVKVKEVWAHGPITNLGMTVPGIPNMFLLMGPGSPGIFSNAFIAIEQQVDWVIDAIEHCRRHEIASIETTRESAAAWTAHVQEKAEPTLFMKTASWYMGANVEGKPRVFMPYVGGFSPYREACDAVAETGYEGFQMSTASIMAVAP